MKVGIGVGLAVVLTSALLAAQRPPADPPRPPDTAREVRLSNVRQLTFGDVNAPELTFLEEAPPSEPQV